MHHIFVDVETGNTDPKTGNIIDYGAVRTDDAGSVLARFTQHVTPVGPVEAEAAKVNQYSEGDWKDGVTFAVAQRTMKEICIDPFKDEKFVVVAHNAPFDRGYIETALARDGIESPFAGRKWVCTMQLAWPFAYHAGVGQSLPALASHFGIRNPAPHTAAGDAETCCRVYFSIMQRFRMIVDGETKVREIGSGIFGKIFDIFGEGS